MAQKTTEAEVDKKGDIRPTWFLRVVRGELTAGLVQMRLVAGLLA